MRFLAGMVLGAVVGWILACGWWQVGWAEGPDDDEPEPPPGVWGASPPGSGTYVAEGDRWPWSL